MSDKASAKALDFTNVREVSGINPVRMEEGDYVGVVKAVNERESKKSGEPMWEFVIGLKDRATATYGYYCVLNVDQLWKVRNLLIAAGISVPKKRVKVDPNKVVGKEIAITLEDDEYEGKEKSTIAAVFSPAELNASTTPDTTDADDDDDDEIEDEEAQPEQEEEKPAPKKKRTRKPKAKPEPEPEEEEDDDIDLDDLDDLDD